MYRLATLQIALGITACLTHSFIFTYVVFSYILTGFLSLPPPILRDSSHHSYILTPPVESELPGFYQGSAPDTGWDGLSRTSCPHSRVGR